MSVRGRSPLVALLVVSATSLGTSVANGSNEGPRTGGPGANPPTRSARADAEAPRESAPALDEPSLPHPRIDVAVELGYQAGGTSLATATSSQGDSETLGAGDGLVMGVAGGVTPLWVSNRAGLGVDASAAIRYWMVGDSPAQAGDRRE